ncbi:aminoglycoside phosphotransferase family protein [Pseudohongiella spirulinae]|uniref:Serine/threonine protein kinase n=1 Tax=Pseudohongiella spirulinae TaxID=1249552 RepID=A0A0S2KGX0_9GAMM|nr:phosphotransferase [Pseudohongiella spirulinae]ALO47363.1 Serine/threonine protein kinase [Pseudohongiella spirulinae]
MENSRESELHQRQQVLQVWARQALREALGDDPGALEMLALGGDASFRRYFRATIPGRSVLLVDAPPPQEDNPAFIRAAAEFRVAGLHTPDILAADVVQGFMVLQDFGDQLYLPVLQQAAALADMATVDTLYGQAMNALLLLQSSAAPTHLPPYDRQRLEQEMCLFDQWFCEQMLGMSLSTNERSMLTELRHTLCDTALAQPQTRVHRDYHSRNLMIRQDEGGKLMSSSPPGVIDFQDAVIGAVTYDLVSLLRDCYIVWPESDVQRWLGGYHAQAVDAGILPSDYSLDQFRVDFDLMGLQRHIKVLGIFCRLALRDGKNRYLHDLPVVMDYVCRVSTRHPVMQPFLTWFETGPLPAMQNRLREARVVLS